MILTVKSAFNLTKLFVLAALAVLMAALTGCGQRGPLYLPKPDTVAAPAKPSTPAMPTTGGANAPAMTVPATPIVPGTPAPNPASK